MRILGSRFDQFLRVLRRIISDEETPIKLHLLMKYAEKRKLWTSNVKSQRKIKIHKKEGRVNVLFVTK